MVVCRFALTWRADWQLVFAFRKSTDCCLTRGRKRRKEKTSGTVPGTAFFFKALVLCCDYTIPYPRGEVFTKFVTFRE